MKKQKPKRSSAGAWLTAGAILYAGVTGGGIGTATYLDATRSPPAQVRQVTLPREVIFDPVPMVPDPLPLCPSDAVLAPPERQDGAVQSAPAGRLTGTVVAGELNVRATPRGRILSQVFRGDRLEILERPTSGPNVGWLRTPAGWVGASYVDLADPPPVVAQAAPGFPCPFPGPLCLPGTTSIFPFNQEPTP